MPERAFHLIFDTATRSFRLGGELDMASATTLRHTLAALPGRSITLDLSELTFIDTAGLACLAAAAQHHARVVLRGLRPHHHRLLDLTNLRAEFEIEPGGCDLRAPQTAGRTLQGQDE